MEKKNKGLTKEVKIIKEKFKDVFMDFLCLLLILFFFFTFMYFIINADYEGNCEVTHSSSNVTGSPVERSCDLGFMVLMLFLGILEIISSLGILTMIVTIINGWRDI